MFSGGLFCAIDVAVITQIGHRFAGGSKSGRKRGSEVDTQRAKRFHGGDKYQGGEPALG